MSTARPVRSINDGFTITNNAQTLTAQAARAPGASCHCHFTTQTVRDARRASRGIPLRRGGDPETVDPVSTEQAPQTGRRRDSSNCDTCAYADQHGWWGNNRPGRSHCSDCHRFWNSTSEGHCPTCCAHFSNVLAFDAHLTESGCRNPGEIVRRDGRPKFVLRSGKFGGTWALVNYRTLPDFDKMRNGSTSVETAP